MYIADHDLMALNTIFLHDLGIK
ncbi:hypothetical protein MNBD_CHLOROFLEXI01-1256, partial [hydrothermal vent metagenome]